jgi:hypothetical protein
MNETDSALEIHGRKYDALGGGVADSAATPDAPRAPEVAPIPGLELRETRAGLKFDDGKPRMELLPFDALELVARVLTFGARKYAAHSWRLVKPGLERYRGAMLRHLAAIDRGEDCDRETGLRHWAHIACNALFCAALDAAEHGVKSGG